MTDFDAMKRVLGLAIKGSGFVSPNPMVGAVILKNGEIISEGFHQKYADVHAEVNAIKKLKNTDLTGTTLVVNLEPCCHSGKTPPCTDLIISKKISRVVIALQDPNPLVSGKGIKKLKEAGVEVITGVLEDEAKWLNRFFIKYITSGLPYIVAKIAQSLDGKIATKNGDSKWISSEESRKIAHKMRSEIDAVLVGKNTILIDNPELNVRNIPGRDPMKVVLDTNLSIALTSKILKETMRSKTIICCNERASKTRKAKNIMLAGVNVLPIETNQNDKIDLTKCLFALSDKFNIASILVEGGSEILSSFANEQMIDELHLFQAPIVVGGGKGSFDSIILKKIEEAIKFRLKSVQSTDKDLHLTYLPER